MSHFSSPSGNVGLVEHPPGFRERRRVNWIFLGLMYGFFYMSRYNFSAVSAAIGERFGWSNADYGKIVSAGVLVYGLSVFLNGPLADKIGGKRAILIGSIGAAIFNLLFGLCFIFLAKEAVWKDGKVIQPAIYAHSMTATTMIATFSALWAANHYFQSFGALSIVKINAAWFHVRERGSFAGIFGIMIQSGRTFAFAFSPFILKYLPWQYCFWIPSAILGVMFFMNRKYVEDSPAKAGYEFSTADETKEEAAQKATLGFVLRKVFASRAAWLIAFSSMCIGMVRNSVDHWYARYVGTVFHVPAKDLSSFAPYQFASWGMPLAAILGGLAAGNASDRIFGSRRAPVIFFAFLGQGLTLYALSQTLHSAWIGCVLLVVISFFIQSAHSLVGGAASMDFGGKKAVATAAGLFDGAQYLAASLVGYGMGRLLDAYKDAKVPGAEFDVWPLAPIPFAIIGSILIARLWYVVPGRKEELSAEVEARRTAMLDRVQTVQRAILASYALLSGAVAILSLILPQTMAKELWGKALAPGAVVMSEMHTALRIGLALVALSCASVRRPPKVLVTAVMLALLACVIGPLFAAVTQATPWAEVQSLKKTLLLDGGVALILLATQVLRGVWAKSPSASQPTT